MLSAERALLASSSDRVGRLVTVSTRSCMAFPIAKISSAPFSRRSAPRCIGKNIFVSGLRTVCWRRSFSNTPI